MLNAEGDKKITEDDFWFVYYGLKEVVKRAREILDRADIIIEGKDDGDNGNDKTNR